MSLRASSTASKLGTRRASPWNRAKRGVFHRFRTVFDMFFIVFHRCSWFFLRSSRLGGLHDVWLPGRPSRRLLGQLRGDYRGDYGRLPQHRRSLI